LHVFGADAALDAYQFLVNWSKSYPGYNNNELYIIGESYGGKQFVVRHLHVSYNVISSSSSIISLSIILYFAIIVVE
jgi:hypothetical protein